MFALRRLATAPLAGSRAAHSLPELPYAYEALEPVISRDIMCLHHSKHHQTYVTNLNAAEEKLKAALSKGDISTAISLEPALRFNGGGHLNHSIFWQNLSPESTQPSDALKKAIEDSFGGVQQLKDQLSASSIGVQGSGWGWLGYCSKSGKLKIATCANQDPLQATTGLVPLLGIDVWEHAYYLQYKNVRADYVKAIFEIVNWKDVSQRFEKAKSC
ncbi:superoxide dismutase [Mn], mitochondrial [Tribolium castaneum]|uniref:Superoxide dismutase n=1 Tax=Tribolium castaneum TaxID=7070 RepID=D6WWA9_TRICA|nr:PREDICTED: superoxide dismutase [Mn], mitochondrial [Tribolium castaneum]EFA09191.1 Superoxide dismutase [Mn], mitochondrial-like Protein [Tribolium castaneum]BAV32138.1 superoxide dismutase 2 [Tribolium castaneum]|eukprot:XP_972440.1 PREDICTED: superoxide dismutase [Mn], mitochondrial [Tribolium castaneum]